MSSYYGPFLNRLKYRKKDGPKTMKVHRIEMRETNGRTYEVIGCKTMKEALEWVRENGSSGYTDEVQIEELDGYWTHYHAQQPRPVETFTARQCRHFGRRWMKPNGTVYSRSCRSVITEGTECLGCMEQVEMGAFKVSKKDDPNFTEGVDHLWRR